MTRVCVAGGVRVNDVVVQALHMSGVEIGQLIGYGHTLMSAAGYFDVMATNARFGFKYPVLCPRDINDPHVLKVMRENPCDLLLVTGWSQIFPKALLDMFPLGAVGLHPTLLPQGRGRAPIPWTIIKGLRRSGVTLFHLDAAADSGDIVAQEAFDIAPDETSTTLYDKVCAASARLCVENVPRLLAGCASRTPQDHSKATVWPKRTPEDGRVSLDEDPSIILRMARALTPPYPPAFIEVCGRKINLSLEASREG